MIKDIVTDIAFLSQKSDDASILDAQIAQDLKDTLLAHNEECVGMAANMIGFLKRIIIVNNNGKYIIMFNPVILKSREEYEVEEGCLSLQGIRSTKRYKKIRVQYYDEEFKEQVMNFSNFSAQIVQHEIDHLNGIII
ncbi:MAG: peptide deformylase [Alphaproteobacteria bacterium]|nr:peptide deformylase [Alphaproteobacteria bacterium]